MKILPFLSPVLRRPVLPFPRFPSALLGATVLEFAVLTGHLMVYPFGLAQERRTAGAPPRRTPRSGPSAVPTEDGGTPTEGNGADGGRPVILLHGFIDNRSVFVVLRRTLTRHGHRHLESLNYSPLTRDLRTAAELLGRHVEEICARTGRPEVDIVGHSLGGLIARYYVQRLGGDRRVRTLVTLGTPHGGTAVAPGAGVHPVVRQMRAGSTVIEELRGPAPGCRTRFVSFWSELDQLMVPVEAACVDHPDLDAVNVRVTGIGHLALPVHPTVAAAVRDALDTPGPQEDATPSAAPPSHRPTAESPGPAGPVAGSASRSSAGSSAGSTARGTRPSAPGTAGTSASGASSVA
ncbi:Extracellular esterase EstB precursor [Streptomyces sp. ADI96-02]|uniref:esterase/lipase family protein n=1 Tax=Streptomyces sp. ADI96-02 TaxID=1522760 RepID=UPI000F54D09A|nr:alpha/beta fold hydrolase [Streptomyces sp. ADI96-02]RPK59723.1 Extracellular esterase EstB precursor [Streptomyces sp. ADI96-02]